jgi:hypothetical protein
MKRRLEVSRDAYFDECFQLALTFDSKPFKDAVPIRAHVDPTTLLPAYAPATDHQQLRLGSVADLGIPPLHIST